MDSRQEDPDNWNLNKQRWAKEVNKAIARCVQDTDVMVCTAVASKRLANKFPEEFKPAVMLIEEGGR
jgi:hypothetical protein